MKQSYLVIIDSSGKPDVVDSEVYRAMTARFASVEVWGMTDRDQAQASRFIDGAEPYKTAEHLPSGEDLSSLPG